MIETLTSVFTGIALILGIFWMVAWIVGGLIGLGLTAALLYIVYKSMSG